MSEEPGSVRGPLSAHWEGVMIEVWVVPGAARTEIVGVHGEALKVRVAAPAEGGRANEAVARLLVDELAATAVELVVGRTGRRKRYLVKGIAMKDAARLVRP